MYLDFHPAIYVYIKTTDAHKAQSYYSINDE